LNSFHSTNDSLPLKSDDPRWGTFFTTAPMTRYAEDLTLLLDAVREVEGPQLDLHKEVDANKLNFFFMTNDNTGMTTPLEPCIKKDLLKVATHFNAKEVNLSQLKWSLDISFSSMLVMPFETIYTATEEGRTPKTAGKEIAKYVTGQSESVFTSVIISTFQYIATNLIPQSRHRQLAKIRKQLKEDIQKMLGDNGVLLYPTFPTAANQHYEIYHKLVDTSYVMVWNTLQFPVTQVHTGFNKQGLPIGIQVVANTGMDHLSLAVAREIQKQFGGWVPAEDIPSREQKS